MLSLLLSLTNSGQAQDTSSTKWLDEVVVLQTKQHLFQPSKKSLEPDSLVMAQYNLTSLADLMAGQSTIHIKSYGLMNLSTTSMRGGNANHTALIWNGLNIQNAMLGQTDLSTIPNFLFDHISIEYGGGSALWGSGAIGGSVHLQTHTPFHKGFSTRVQLNTGSFGLQKAATNIQFSAEKIASNTRFYYCTAANNYPYKDTTDKENPNKQVTHANYLSRGFMQELAFWLTKYQKLECHVWYNNTFRNLPSYTSMISKQHQEDKNLKCSTQWQYIKNKLQSTVRVGYFNDELNYNDSLAAIYSSSQVNTFIAENDHIYTLPHHRFNVGANYTSYLANTHNYVGRQQIRKLAFFAAYQWQFLNAKCNYNLSVRQETSNQTLIPLTGNTGFQYVFDKYMTLNVNGSKSYRQPTLNDLYWSPGGNRNLKSEESDELEGILKFKTTKHNYSVLIEGAYFNRHTSNWIIWLPSAQGYSSPVNIAKVYSRGTETTSEFTYRKRQCLVKLILHTSYVLATSQKPVGENDQSVGRQLIYTPRYSGQVTLLFNYKAVVFLINQHYTGYRFTSTDNTSWLHPYYVTNFKMSYAYEFQSVKLELFGSINNAFNKSYVVVANVPMPMRNFEMCVSMKYGKKKSIKTDTIND